MTLILYYQFHSEIPALPAQHLVPLCNLTQRADIGLNTTNMLALSSNVRFLPNRNVRL
jgi:hypothetical protein